jgi:phage terminase large subunit-like protein
VRLEGLSVLFERGSIIVVEELPKKDDFLNEYLEYPASHDDQLDCIDIGVDSAWKLLEDLGVIEDENEPYEVPTENVSLD